MPNWKFYVPDLQDVLCKFANFYSLWLLTVILEKQISLQFSIYSQIFTIFFYFEIQGQVK